MTKLTKLFAGVLCALAIATSAFAGTSTTAATQDTALFNANELGIQLGTGYVVDRSAAFKNAYSLNLSGGAFYFITKNIGFEASVPFYQTKGLSVDQVNGGAILRLPLSSNVPILRNIAVYTGFDGVYNWSGDQKQWSYLAKAGFEVRFAKYWGLYTEGQYRNDKFSDWNNGETSIQAGLRLRFK